MIKDSEMLLINVTGAYNAQKEQIDRQEERLVKEIQILLLNDSTEWNQSKQQIVFRLSQLKTMIEVADFAE